MNEEAERKCSPLVGWRPLEGLPEELDLGLVSDAEVLRQLREEFAHLDPRDSEQVTQFRKKVEQLISVIVEGEAGGDISE